MRRIVYIVLINCLFAQQQLWVERYNGPENGGDGAKAIALDASGNVYVTSTSFGLNTNFDYVTIKYSQTGIEEWVNSRNSKPKLSVEPNFCLNGIINYWLPCKCNVKFYLYDISGKFLSQVY